MPHHLYCSRSFEQRFRWKATGAANAIIAQCVGAAVRSPFLEPLVVADVNGRGTTLEVDPITTPRAVLVLFRALPAKARLPEPLTSLA